MTAIDSRTAPAILRFPTATTQPARVCFMIDRLSRAGTESQLLALIRDLDRTKVEPTLVLLDGEDELSRSLEPENCEVLRLGVRNLASVGAARAANRLRAFWRETRPDVVQAYFLDSAYFGVPLAKWCGVPHVLRVRNNLGYWLTGKHRLMNRVIGRWVDATLTNTDAAKEALVDRDGMQAENVVVLENGVDVNRYSRSLLPDTSRPVVRVGCVANLRAVKNIDGLMRVASGLLAHFPRLQFEVAGDGEERTALERLHAELNLGDRFKFRGSVSDMPAFLRSIDIAVLPSHSEGMSNALLEYMAAGRAIVATDVGANARLITHGKHGYIVPPGDESAMAEAILRFLNEPMRAAAFGSVARRRAAAEFSREAMLRRFEDYYLGLVENRSAAPRTRAAA